jgi:hypothetical protein
LAEQENLPLFPLPLLSGGHLADDTTISRTTRRFLLEESLVMVPSKVPPFTTQTGFDQVRMMRLSRVLQEEILLQLLLAPLSLPVLGT